MAQHLKLSVDERTEFGNGPTGRLRRSGRVPCIVYQPGQDSLAFSVPELELRRVLSGGGRTSVIDLTIGETGARPVLFKDWQLHPVRGEVIHVDFQEVDLTVAVEVSVFVTLTGTAIGVREGGILDQPTREITIRALPDALPDEITHDVSEMQIGDALTVSDLSAPDGVEITSEDELVIASIVLPRVAVEEEEEAEGVEGEEGVEGAEPVADAGEDSAPADDSGDSDSSE